MMLGYYFAEEFAPSGRDSAAFRLKAFLKFEQLSGYARWHVNKDGDLRGITEVRRRLLEQDTIRIAADSAGQILSNQKTYGLWGLYTMPARASGLISQDELTLTPLARAFVEKQVLGVLRKTKADAEKHVGDILKQDHFDIEPAGRDSSLLVALGKALSPGFSKDDRRFYRDHLVLGTVGTCEWQTPFATMVEDFLPPGEEFCLKHLAELIKRAGRAGEPKLASHLQSIRDLEALLVPFASLFSYLQARDGARINAVVDDLAKAWGKGLAHIDASAIDGLGDAITKVYGDSLAAGRFFATASALRTGDFREAIRLCLEHNAFVMRSRGGAEPWVVVAEGRLDVRYRDDDTGDLASSKELAGAWRNSFYLDPLKVIADQLRGPE